LRQCSRESLNEIREMRTEFRRNMEYLNRQLERLAKMVEDKLSDEDWDNLFPDASQPWLGNNWKASAGAGTPANFDGEFSQTEMQARMRQMEYRLGILEKALQRN
jgi:HAMP domain-containing protein